MDIMGLLIYFLLGVLFDKTLGARTPIYVLKPGGGAALEHVSNVDETGAERMARYLESRKQFSPAELAVGDKDASAVVKIKGGFPLMCSDIIMKESSNRTYSHRRRKRQVLGNHLVEFLLFLDHEIFNFWLARNGGNTTETKAVISDYYANIINHINRRYLTAIRPGFTIQLVLSGLFIAETKGTSPWTESIASNGRADADQALTSFRNFVRDNRNTLPPYDHAQLVSGYDLTRGGSTANAGLAFTPSVCTSNAASVVEDTRSQALATVMAHELGHSLGSFHDGDGNSCSSADSFVMDSGLGIPSRANRANPWTFSTCSVDKIRNNLARLSPICTLTLQGTPIPIDSFLKVELGQKYPADLQCEIFLGAGSKVCRGSYTSGSGLTYDDLCYELRCLDKASGRCFASYAHDGTTCGNKKWCVSGQCVTTELAPATPENCPLGNDPDTPCTQLSCLNPALALGPCCFTCSPEGSNSTGASVSDGLLTLQTRSATRFGVTVQEINFTTGSTNGQVHTTPSRPTRPTQSNVQPFRSRRPTQSNVQPPRPTQSNVQIPTRFSYRTMTTGRTMATAGTMTTQQPVP